MNRYNAEPSHLTAAKEALAEIAEILETFEGAVLAGGFIPFLLIPQDIEPHEGTIDIDVILDPVQLKSDSEYTLHEILTRRLFQQDPGKPFRWYKTYSGQEVLLEFLAGGIPPPSGLRLISHEDVHASVIEGLEIAFTSPQERQIGESRMRIAAIAPFLTMKSVALERREADRKSKDASDILYCLRNYPGGNRALAEEIRPYLQHPLIEQAMHRLNHQFANDKSPGVIAYTESPSGTQDQDLKRREAIERVKDLLRALEIV